MDYSAPQIADTVQGHPRIVNDGIRYLWKQLVYSFCILVIEIHLLTSFTSLITSAQAEVPDIANETKFKTNTQYNQTIQ
jgi:hypothetical protein